MTKSSTALPLAGVAKAEEPATMKSDAVEREGPSRIFIIDDHPVFRFGLSALLRAEGIDPCGEAEDAKSALSRLAEARADLVTIDLSLAGGSGLGLIREVKARWPNVPVLALSMHDELLFAERVLRAGAIGYLNKNLAPSFLLEGIRRALRGELVISAAVTEMLLQRMNHKGRDGRSASPTALLSDRELEILDLMGQGLGTREVAGALHISAKTVETHQAHMKNKLGLHSGSGLMRLAVSWVENPDKC